MKICLCCSLTFTNEVTEIAKMLESMGHEVLLPNSVINRLTDQPDFDPVRTKIETDSCHTHVDKIRAADVVLVCNFLKNCTAGYIGANSFAELFAAHYFDKPIFALFPLPDQPYIADELGSFGIKVLNGSLEAFDNHVPNSAANAANDPTPSNTTAVTNDPAPSSGSSQDTAACQLTEPITSSAQDTIACPAKEPSASSPQDTAACSVQEPVAKVEVETASSTTATPAAEAAPATAAAPVAASESTAAAAPAADTFDPLANLKTAFAKIRTSWDNFWNK